MLSKRGLLRLEIAIFKNKKINWNQIFEHDLADDLTPNQHRSL